MRIAHYCEFEDRIKGGISVSVNQQRSMLTHRDIEYVTRPRMDVDIVHLNVMGPRSIATAYRARRHGIPVIVHTHVTAEDFRDSLLLSNTVSKPLKPYLGYAYGLGDHLICPSQYTADIIDAYTDTPRSVISNGVNTEKLEGYESLREEYLDRFNLTPPVVFMVGHVFKRKGLATFVEAARELPTMDFVWFGPIDRHLKDRSTKKLIDRSPDNCRFTGFIEDIRGAYAAGDIFFFPTYEENEGMTLLEAMATEKAILVRDIETFEWLDDGTHCLKASGDFSRKLERLQDTELREELGSQAGELSNQFELTKIARELEQCYEAVLQGSANDERS